jgi:hypothetical protein
MEQFLAAVIGDALGGEREQLKLRRFDFRKQRYASQQIDFLLEAPHGSPLLPAPRPSLQLQVFDVVSPFAIML